MSASGSDLPTEAVTVVVTLKDGPDIMGVLRDLSATVMVLAGARIEGVDSNNRPQWQAAPGEVVIPMENVAYYQRGLPTAILDQIRR